MAIVKEIEMHASASVEPISIGQFLVAESRLE